MSEKHSTDVVIIGAGPVGLFAVFECGTLKMKCHVVDTLDFIGGQCNALYPEKPIYDIPAFASIDAQDLIKNLEEQAAPYEPVYHLGQQVVGLERIKEVPSSAEKDSPIIAKGNSGNDGYNFIIKTSKDTEISCKAVIIAAGCGAFGPNRPPLEGIEQYEAGGSVAYMVGAKESFRGKNVVVAGGGDSAVDWTLSLADIANKVSLVHRRAKFRCAPENADKIKELAASGKIDLVVPYQLNSLKGENGNLEAVVVADLDGNKKEIEADHLLPFYGLAMELGPIANWGLNIEKKHIDVTPHDCSTNIEGIFAIGDICDYKGKLKLITCGFSEAAMAAHAAYPLVHDEALHFEYSTTKGVPG